MANVHFEIDPQPRVAPDDKIMSSLKLVSLLAEQLMQLQGIIEQGVPIEAIRSITITLDHGGVGKAA